MTKTKLIGSIAAQETQFFVLNYLYGLHLSLNSVDAG
jgi:hypothetical protein